MKKNLRRKIYLMGITFILCFLMTHVSLHAASNFFPIAVWMEAGPDLMGYNENTASNYFSACFAKMVEMGFNTVRPSNLPHHLPAVVEQFMSLAQQYGLKVILDPGEGHNLMKYSSTELQQDRDMWKEYLRVHVTSRFSTYSSLLGYSVIDEPSLYQVTDLNGDPITVSKAEKLARWNLIVGMLDELDPSHPDYTVFTSSSWLATAVSTYSRKAISYDNYPFTNQVDEYVMGPVGDLNWYTHLQAFNEASQPQYTVPQLSVIQSFDGNSCPWRFPRANELRTCVYTSLASGARGIMYFIYMNMPATVDPNTGATIIATHGLVNSNHQAYNQEVYDATIALNDELAVLGPVIGTLQSTTAGVVSGWSTSTKVLSGTYTTTAGVKYYIIANKNPDPESLSFNHNIQLPASNYYLLDKYSGQTFNPNSSGLVSVSLAPAQGRVLQEKMNQSITVSTPTTSWIRGTTYPISWTSVGITGNVTIQLIKGSTITTLTSTQPYNTIPYNYAVPNTLATGTYYIKIFKGSIVGQSGNFTIAAPSAAAIQLDKTTMAFTGDAGNTLTGTFTVKNSGSGTLSYTVSDNQSWITVSPTSGTSTGENDTITVTVNTSGLTKGANYSGTITVAASGITSKTIAVQLRVRYQKYTMWRYFNANIEDHYYTTDFNELGNGANGYVYEGPAFTVYKEQEVGSVPLYQYWNNALGDHYYTTVWSELGNGAGGYVYQKVACYVYTTAETGSKILYRYYNSTSGDHYYTTLFSELGNGAGGYIYEGPACRVF